MYVTVVMTELNNLEALLNNIHKTPECVVLHSGVLTNSFNGNEMTYNGNEIT